MKSAIEQAVAVCGSQSELARRCGVKQGNVWYWLRVGRVPAEHCRAVSEATGAQITVYDLRPDIFGPTPSSSPTYHGPERRYGDRRNRDRRAADRHQASVAGQDSCE